MLQELTFVEGELEDYEEQLAWMQRYNDQYDPDMAAEAAWPLMKMRRFDANDVTLSGRAVNGVHRRLRGERLEHARRRPVGGRSSMRRPERSRRSRRN